MSADLIAEARGFIEGSDPKSARTALIRDLTNALEAAEQAHTPTDDALAVARNIVNQIGDLWSEHIPSQDWVRVRQETNDRLDKFVVGLIESLRHTPTDDERDLIDAASAAFKARGGAPDWEEDAIARDLIIRWHLRGFEDGEGFGRRSEVPEPSPSHLRAALEEAWSVIQRDVRNLSNLDPAELGGIIARALDPATVPEPHGEPSDAEVLAADDAMLSFRSGTQHEMIRAMLRAASAITEQGENRG